MSDDNQPQGSAYLTEAENIWKTSVEVIVQGGSYTRLCQIAEETIAVAAGQAAVRARVNAAIEAELSRLRESCQKQDDEICQTLGRALGWPLYADDQANFPSATEANGVIIGDEVAETMADHAVRRITALEAENARLREALDRATQSLKSFQSAAALAMGALPPSGAIADFFASIHAEAVRGQIADDEHPTAALGDDA